MMMRSVIVWLAVGEDFDLLEVEGRDTRDRLEDEDEGSWED